MPVATFLVSFDKLVLYCDGFYGNKKTPITTLSLTKFRIQKCQFE